jgi:hypothetical protein
MRENLVGYLLDALEPAEQEMLERELARDPQLKAELDLIARSLHPLAADRLHFDPPPGLAHRTCEFVAQQAQVMLATPPASVSSRRMSMTDMVMAASIFLAASALFLPALTQSRFAARVTSCQNNLRQIGMALGTYSLMNRGFFPVVPLEGNCAAAGIYAPCLLETGLLDGSHLVVCSASPLADQVAEFRIPTRVELHRAEGAELARLLAQMGGSYGYTLGYISKGNYQPTKNLRRVRFALMADAPSGVPPFHTLNHGACGQNVLFEDFHVVYLTTCKAHGCNDDIFTNDDGQVAPGLHAHDAVIGPSFSKPLVPVSRTLVPAQGR